MDLIYLRAIIHKDKTNFVQTLKNPRPHDQRDKELVIVEMVEKDYHQVLTVFIEFGAKLDIYAMKKETDKEPDTLLQIAFRNKYTKTIEVLLDQINRE